MKTKWNRDVEDMQKEFSGVKRSSQDLTELLKPLSKESLDTFGSYVNIQKTHASVALLLEGGNVDEPSLAQAQTNENILSELAKVKYSKPTN